AAADLQLDTAHRRASLRGRVLRCAVCRLHPSGVSYRAAIAFDRQWPCFADGWSEYPVPTGEEQPAPAERVNATRGVACKWHRLPGLSACPPSPLMALDLVTDRPCSRR